MYLFFALVRFDLENKFKNDCICQNFLLLFLFIVLAFCFRACILLLPVGTELADISIRKLT